MLPVVESIDSTQCEPEIPLTSEWIAALPAADFDQLVAGYDEVAQSDATSPLTDFLAAWIEIEQRKQSLMELLA